MICVCCGGLWFVAGLPADDMTAEEFLSYLDRMEKGYADYQTLLDKGLSREQARIGLPLSTYTEVCFP